MKKYILITAALLLGILMYSSCKKTYKYICVCTDTSKGVDFLKVLYPQGETKEQAKTNCPETEDRFNRKRHTTVAKCKLE